MILVDYGGFIYHEMVKVIDQLEGIATMNTKSPYRVNLTVSQQTSELMEPTSELMEPKRKLPSYLTVSQLSEKYPAFSESSLRYLIFNEDKNGIKMAIKRIGRKILFNEDRFVEWVENFSS